MIEEGFPPMATCRPTRTIMAFYITKVLILIAVLVVSHQKVIEIAPGIQYENCGPPFNLTISPNPPKVRQELTFTLEYKAAHDFIAGVAEAYINVWPYYYKKAYCADGKTVDPKGCYVSKGERRVLSWPMWVDDNIKEINYVANATLRNEANELMLCARGWLKLT